MSTLESCRQAWEGANPQLAGDVSALTVWAKRSFQMMAQEIGIGMVLIKEGTPLPQGLQVESEPYLKGWRLIKNFNSSTLDRKLCDSGWTFFFMAGEIKAMAFGSNASQSTRRAVGIVIANMKSGFNSLEISRVKAEGFLGLPYITVAGHARNIQESMYLFQSKNVLEWVKAPLVAA
jgi:hypothetical protein